MRETTRISHINEIQSAGKTETQQAVAMISFHPSPGRGGGGKQEGFFYLGPGHDFSEL